MECNFHLYFDDPHDKFLPKISSVVKKIVIVYSALTALLAILYFTNGMTIFDALLIALLQYLLVVFQLIMTHLHTFIVIQF